MMGVDSPAALLRRMSQTFFLASPVPPSTGRSAGRVLQRVPENRSAACPGSGKTGGAVHPEPVVSTGGPD